MIQIPLTQGKFALVDDRDADQASHKWRAVRSGQTWYAQRWAWMKEQRSGAATNILLHRAILGLTNPAVHVDHENGNGLDCRRHNLRQATRSQNQGNSRRPRTNTSGFKGVSRGPSGQWRASIRRRGTSVHLGTFSTPEAAARVYDEAARRFRGEFACVNFPKPGERAA